VLIFQGLRKT